MDNRKETGVCCKYRERKSIHSDKQVKNFENRLNKIEGQIRGLNRLIKKDTYCDDILTQISANQSALNGVSKLLLESHLRSCVSDKIRLGDGDIVDEVIVTISRLMK